MKKSILLIIFLVIPMILSNGTPEKQVVLPYKEDITCHAENIYFEARGEGTKEMQAVIEVAHNRAIQRNKTICEIIYEKKQFSWTSFKKKKVRDLENEKQLVIDWYLSPTNHTKGSTFFHAVYVTPEWSSSLKKQVRIGNHIFYSEKQ